MNKYLKNPLEYHPTHDTVSRFLKPIIKCYVTKLQLIKKFAQGPVEIENGAMTQVYLN